MLYQHSLTACFYSILLHGHGALGAAILADIHSHSVGPLPYSGSTDAENAALINQVLEFNEPGPALPSAKYSVPTGPIVSNKLGETMSFILTSKLPRPDFITETIEKVILFVSDATHRKTIRTDPIRFWFASRGPELIQAILTSGSCGFDNESDSRCMVVLTLTSALLGSSDLNEAPAIVNRIPHLDRFCHSMKDELVQEMSNKLFRNPTTEEPLEKRFRHPQDKFRYILKTGAYAADWLITCPNLVPSVSWDLRLQVFRHNLIRIRAMDNLGKPTIEVEDIRRDHIIADSVKKFLMSDDFEDDPKILRQGPRWISFTGEPSVGNGVRTDWFESLGKAFFDPSLGLFVAEHAGPKSYVRINPGELPRDPKSILELPDESSSSSEDSVSSDSSADSSHDSSSDESSDSEEAPKVYTENDMYEIVGRFVGIAIATGHRLPVDLSTMLYAKLMRKFISLGALEEYEPSAFKFFKKILKSDEPNSLGIPLPSTAQLPEDVVEWPSDVSERLAIIINAVTNYVTGDVQERFTAFQKGLFYVVDQHVFRCGILTSDLRGILYGESEVNVNDLITSFIFDEEGTGYTPESPQILMLQQILNNWTEEEKRQFLHFVTGSSSIPAGGFHRLNPRIFIVRYRVPGVAVEDLFPKAHTCFNGLDLPEYNSSDLMESRLRTSMAHGTGFDDA